MCFFVGEWVGMWVGVRKRVCVCAEKSKRPAGEVTRGCACVVCCMERLRWGTENQSFNLDNGHVTRQQRVPNFACTGARPFFLLTHIAHADLDRESKTCLDQIVHPLSEAGRDTWITYRAPGTHRQTRKKVSTWIDCCPPAELKAR